MRSEHGRLRSTAILGGRDLRDQRFGPDQRGDVVTSHLLDHLPRLSGSPDRALGYSRAHGGSKTRAE